jgi:hypothetical protein
MRRLRQQQKLAGILSESTIVPQQIELLMEQPSSLSIALM